MSRTVGMALCLWIVLAPAPAGGGVSSEVAKDWEDQYRRIEARIKALPDDPKAGRFF